MQLHFIKHILASLAFLTICDQSIASEKSPPKEVLQLTQKLAALHQNSPTEDSDVCFEYQRVKLNESDEIYLVCFCVDGYLWSSNSSQFLAVIDIKEDEYPDEEEADSKKEAHYLRTSTLFGGGNFRAIETLKVVLHRIDNAIYLEIDALKNSLQDSPNFPTTPIKVWYRLNNSLTEIVDPSELNKLKKAAK